MATEALDKPQQQQEQLETWKSLYRSAWDTAFREFMFLMSEQYSLELTVRVNGETVESPIVKFWRESLQSLTPNQMREGLKRYMDSERRSFKPTPGDIKANVEDVPGTDRPIKRKDPECPECEGTGWRMIEAESRATGNKTQRAADCFCVRIEYGGETYTPAEKQLPAAPELEPAEVLGVLQKKLGEVAAKSPIKSFPPERREMTDAEWNARARELEQQKKSLLEKGGEPTSEN